jgi:hypothetical protein
MSDAEKIKAIQDYKASHVDSNFKSSTPSTRAQIADRIINEGNDLQNINTVHPEIANLKSQGMSDKEIARISSIFGLNNKYDLPGSILQTAGNINTDISSDNNLNTKNSQSVPTQSITNITQAMPNSGYNLDALNYNVRL